MSKVSNLVPYRRKVKGEMATLSDSLIPLLFKGMFRARDPEDESNSPVFWLIAIMVAIVIILNKIMDVVENIKDYV